MTDLIQQAFRDWNEHRAYVDNGGNYRVRPEAATPTHRPRGKIAPWNKEVKRAFPSSAEFHAAAQEAKQYNYRKGVAMAQDQTTTTTETRSDYDKCAYFHESVNMACGGFRKDHASRYGHPFTEPLKPPLWDCALCSAKAMTFKVLKEHVCTTAIVSKPTGRFECIGCGFLAFDADDVRSHSCAPALQPALDAGERWEISTGGLTIYRRTPTAYVPIVQSCYAEWKEGSEQWPNKIQSQEIMRQIVADRRSAAAVPKLVEALKDARELIAYMPNPRSKEWDKAIESQVAAIDEALTTVNQTGGERG